MHVATVAPEERNRTSQDRLRGRQALLDHVGERSGVGQQLAEPGAGLDDRPIQHPAGGRIQRPHFAAQADDQEARRQARDDLGVQTLGLLGARRQRPLLLPEPAHRVLERGRDERPLRVALAQLPPHAADRPDEPEKREREHTHEGGDQRREPDEGVCGLGHINGSLALDSRLSAAFLRQRDSAARRQSPAANRRGALPEEPRVPRDNGVSDQAGGHRGDGQERAERELRLPVRAARRPSAPRPSASRESTRPPASAASASTRGTRRSSPASSRRRTRAPPGGAAARSPTRRATAGRRQPPRR